MLVDADRAAPGGQFVVIGTWQGPTFLNHAGLNPTRPEVSMVDVRALDREEVIDLREDGRSRTFDVTGAGLAFYERVTTPPDEGPQPGDSQYL